MEVEGLVDAEHENWLAMFLDEVMCSSDHPDPGPQQQQQCLRDDDNNELKRQSRLQRNRQSAWQSRQRKKWYVSELEAKCRMLQSHCTRLEQSVHYVSAENVVLRQEMLRLSKVVKGGVAEPAVLVKGSLPLEFLSRNFLLMLLCMWCPMPMTRATPQLVHWYHQLQWHHHQLQLQLWHMDTQARREKCCLTKIWWPP